MKKLFYLLFMSCTTTLFSQTALPTYWGFENPSPTSDSLAGPAGWKTKLDVSATGTTPFVYATGCSGQACKLDATGEYVQIWFAQKPGILSYNVKGQFASGSFSGSFKVQQSVDGNTWTDLRNHTAMPGSCVRFTETPASASRYIRFYYDTKVSGSNVALDSVFLDVPGVSTSASINMKQGTNNLASGATYIVGKTAATTFTIENKGTVDALTISAINVTGVNAPDYTITNAPTSVAANSSATFTLNFNPASQGSSFAKVTVNSSDADNAAFDINLYGIGGNYATEPAQQPSNLAFTNVKAYMFNVGYTASGAENYIVLRKKGSAVTEEPVDGQSYSTGDQIGGAQVTYIGSATSFKPTYIIANSNYNFAVFAYNGPKGFENYLTTSPLKGQTTTPGGNAGTYYTGVNPSANTFLTDLRDKINPHDTIFYGNYTPTMINSFMTRDTTGGKKVVNCVYTNLPYIYDEPFIWWGNGTGGTLSREHTFAQSWMPSNGGGTQWFVKNGKEVPEYNDQHHLFPADQLQGNVKRSNYPFGDVVGTPIYVSPTGSGKYGPDAKGNNVWEPKDSQKGDAARAIFYMCTTYNGLNGFNWSLSAVNGGKQQDSILKKWHMQDPPDAFEIARHEYVASIQHNRNPFIDNISWVNYINFNNMTYITGVTPTPVISITSPTGGESWSAASAHNITWISSDVDSVKIELWLSDTLFSVVTPRTVASAGSYNWTPGNNISSTNAKIRVGDTKSATSSTSANYFSITPATGIREENMEKMISVYPNPSIGMITLNMKEAVNATCNIFDATGRLVIHANLLQKETQLKLENKGVYILQLNIADKVSYKKLIVE